jgi:hypothetical protein
MGGKESEKFNKFVDICCTAYTILRKQANIFINLFSMVTVWKFHGNLFVDVVNWNTRVAID